MGAYLLINIMPEDSESVEHDPGEVLVGTARSVEGQENLDNLHAFEQALGRFRGRVLLEQVLVIRVRTGLARNSLSRTTMVEFMNKLSESGRLHELSVELVMASHNLHPQGEHTRAFGGLVHDMVNAIARISGAVNHFSSIVNEDQLQARVATVEMNLSRIQALIKACDIQGQICGTAVLAVPPLTRQLPPCHPPRRIDFVGASFPLNESMSGFTVGISSLDLTRLIENLVENAERVGAGKIDVFVEVEGATAGGILVIRVVDDGLGFAGQSLEQASEASRERDGTHGNGLGICRDLCTAAGGTFELKNPNGPGATFIIRLPFLLAD